MVSPTIIARGIGMLKAFVKSGAARKFLVSGAVSFFAGLGLDRLVQSLGGDSGIEEIPGVLPLTSREAEKIVSANLQMLERSLGTENVAALLTLMRLIPLAPPGVVKSGEDNFLNGAIVVADAINLMSWSSIDSSFTAYYDTLGSALGKTEGQTSQPGISGPNGPVKTLPTPLSQVESKIRQLATEEKQTGLVLPKLADLKTLWQNIRDNYNTFANTPVVPSLGREVRLNKMGLQPFEAIEYAKWYDRILGGEPEGIVDTKVSNSKVQTVSLKPTNLLNLLLGVYGPSQVTNFKWDNTTASKIAEVAHLFLAQNDGVSGDLGLAIKGSTHKSGAKSVKIPVFPGAGFSNDKHFSYVKAGILTDARRDEVYAAWKQRLAGVQAGTVRVPIGIPLKGKTL